ncbi:MAG: GTP-binding protein, partial [Flaviramulus sp.]|nr:GTP-binding protein [Flaviramulus sp.]
GLFGPNPTVWSLFIFLHFLIAGLFIAFGIWTYTKWNLEQNFTIQASITIFMVLIWVTLYFIGSFGKASSINDMRSLNNFMNEILENK